MAAKKKTPALLRSEVNARLEDLPLQIEALQSAMEEFGDDFKLTEFKPAFERKSGIKSYNKVQAVERAFGRVQNWDRGGRSHRPSATTASGLDEDALGHGVDSAKNLPILPLAQ